MCPWLFTHANAYTRTIARSHTHTLTHARAFTHTHTHVSMCTRAHAHTRIAHIHLHTLTYSYTHTRTHILTHTTHTHTHTHTRVNVRTHMKQKHFTSSPVVRYIDYCVQSNTIVRCEHIPNHPLFNNNDAIYIIIFAFLLDIVVVANSFLHAF